MGAFTSVIDVWTVTLKISKLLDVILCFSPISCSFLDFLLLLLVFVLPLSHCTCRDIDHFCIDPCRFNLSHTLKDIAASSLILLSSILSVLSQEVSFHPCSSISSFFPHFAELILSLMLPLCLHYHPSYQAFTYLAPSAVSFGLKNILLLMWNLCDH